MPETILSQLHQHAWSSNLRPELNNQGQFYKMLEQSFIFFNGIMHIFFDAETPRCAYLLKYLNSCSVVV
jgi:hypothetical protein